MGQRPSRRAAGARFLTTALLLLSIGSAATTRGSPIAWSLQFAAFHVFALVFLATVWLHGHATVGPTRRRAPRIRLHDVRRARVRVCSRASCAGAYAMRLDPALYAMPAMLGAISADVGLEAARPFEPDTRRLAILRLGGFSLSALAFALALSRSHIPTVLSGLNLLTTGLLGAALYVASLRCAAAPGLSVFDPRCLAGRVHRPLLLRAVRIPLHRTGPVLAARLSEHLPRPFFAILAIAINLGAGVAVVLVREALE